MAQKYMLDEDIEWLNAIHHLLNGPEVKDWAFYHYESQKNSKHVLG